jgi:hypothetical protein
MVAAPVAFIEVNRSRRVDEADDDIGFAVLVQIGCDHGVRQGFWTCNLEPRAEAALAVIKVKIQTKILVAGRYVGMPETL